MRPDHACVPRVRDITAVVFDLDGVLVDSEPLHFRAANRVLGRYGHAIGEVDYVACIGLGEVATWRLWRERYGLSEPLSRLLDEHTAARLEEIAAAPAPIPEAVDLARRLHGAGLPLAIASSSTPPVIDALLRAIGLDNLFPVRVSGEEVQHSKPAPDVYLAAAARLRVAARACLAIEDSAPGVTAATRAGMTCIAVPNRWTAHQDFGNADMVLESLRYFPLLLL
jgi:HAD superfamily hydrolase (TIGR01509 family)